MSIFADSEIDSGDIEDAAAEPKFNPWARHRARRLVLQAIYQWQLSALDIADLEAQFSTNDGMKRADASYFRELVRGITSRTEELDRTFAPLLDRAVEALDQVERAALRLGTYELLFGLDVPVRVVIDEAVNLASTFGAEGSHGYINGVLDKLARQLRSVEMAARR